MTTRLAIQNFSREQDLVLLVARYLRNRTFRLQRTEVPFFEYRIDMYGYSSQTDRTIAVELKLKKWARAFEQALLYQLCSDLVYIAVPADVTRVVEQGLLDEYGLGLLAVQATRCREVLPARPSSVLRRHYREHYLSLMSKDP